MKIELDDTTITIQGVKYSKELFDAVGVFPEGLVFRVIKRDPEGVVTVERLEEVERMLGRSK